MNRAVRSAGRTGAWLRRASSRGRAARSAGMSSRACLIALAAILGACHAGPAAQEHAPASAGIRYSGGDGTTLERAVIISGANEMTGIDAEYAWLHEHVPGGKVTRQELITQGQRAYDKLDVSLPQGGDKSFYFDISGGYGKLF